MKQLIVDADMNNVYVGNHLPQNVSVLYNKLVPLTPVLGFLPAVVRYISPIADDGTSTVIIESRPKRVHLGYDDDNSNQYHLPLPWQHWFFKLVPSNEIAGRHRVDEIRLAFSMTQLQYMDHQFIPAYGPNLVYSSDTVYSPAVGRVQNSTVDKFIERIVLNHNDDGNKYKCLNSLFDVVTYEYWTALRHADSLDNMSYLMRLAKILFPDTGPETTAVEYRRLFDGVTIERLFEVMDTVQFQKEYVNAQASFADIASKLELPRRVDIVRVMEELDQEAGKLPRVKKMSDKDIADNSIVSAYQAILAADMNSYASTTIHVQNYTTSIGTAASGVYTASTALQGSFENYVPLASSDIDQQSDEEMTEWLDSINGDEDEYPEEEYDEDDDIL